MGIYAHAIHLHVPDKDTGRLLATGLLKSQQSLIICKPYDCWINVYLEMGLSYKDVLDLPTATYIELNCYDSEGLDLRVYASDRMVFLFESGCGDVGEEEDQILEIAEEIWKKENPELASKAAIEKPTVEGEGEPVAVSQPTTFWTLSEEEQEPFLKKARESSEYKDFVNDSQSEDALPDSKLFEPYLPEGRTLEELNHLLGAISCRLHGPPTDEAEIAAIEKWMNGERHSTKAEDYVAALSRFFGLRGSVWSLETIQAQLADKVDRRIIATDALDAMPAAE